MRKFFSVVSVMALLLGLTTVANAASYTTIPHAVGIYLSPTGQRYFAQHLDEIVKRNGVNLNKLKLADQHFETGVKTVDELLPSNPALTGLIKQVKYYFKKFFRSQEISFKNTHNFILNVEDINITSNWGRIGLEIGKSSWQDELNRGVKFQFAVELKNILVTVNKIRVEDSQHTFLEKIGVDDLKFGFQRDSVPLRFNVPVYIKVKNGKLDFTVETPETNLMDVQLALDYKRPMLLPEFEIIVNGHRGKVRLDEVERLLRQKHSELLTGLKKSVQEYIDEEFTKKVDTVLTEVGNKKFQQKEFILPLGAPNPRVKQMYYKLSPAFIGHREEHFYFALNSFIKDPFESGSSSLRDWYSGEWGAQLRTLNSQHYDVAVSLNEGMINRLLQLSTKRGYYDTISSDSGTTYRLDQQPYVRLAGRTYHSAPYPAVQLKILYNVTGFSSLAVNNPVPIEFDLKIKFKVVNGKVQMVSDGPDISSITVPRSAARWEFLWPKIISSAKEQLGDMRRDLTGIVISDDIPIPNDVFGFPMKITNAVSDPNGNIMVFMNYDN